MAEASKIEWTDSTFNPWIGCTKIAPACDHCYAADMAKRYGWVEWGNHPRKRTSDALWAKPRQWQKGAAEFFAAHGRRRRVFCASLADVFDNQVPSEWRGELWNLILSTPDLDWLLLTKRPQNIADMLPHPVTWEKVRHHVWLGTTVEDQDHYDRNVPHLVKHDAAVRFLSIEPMLGPLNLGFGVHHHPSNDRGHPAVQALVRAARAQLSGGHMVDWVIAGGESGPHARPSDPQWFRSLRDQCVAAGVPFLFKQWGEWGDAEQMSSEELEHWDVLGKTAPGVARVGKKAAGRHLDGVLHDGFPSAA